MSVTMGGKPAGGRSVLTDEQQMLVVENRGLVGVHLGHRVATPRRLKRERELADLFQEGSLALVRAALTYQADEHGEFAPYALFRIRGRIHRTLHEYFATIRVPTRVLRRFFRTSGEASLVEWTRGPDPWMDPAQAEWSPSCMRARTYPTRASWGIPNSRLPLRLSRFTPGVPRIRQPVRSAADLRVASTAST
jgi:hypothetical protein